MMKRTWHVLVGASLVFIGATSIVVIARQQDVTGPTVLKYSNVRYSPARDGLVGANIRLVREDGTLTGRLTLFEGNAGRTYRLRGTMSGGHIRFSVRAGGRTLRFRGHIEDGSLVGTLTTRLPDGSKEVSEFKARRLYR